MKAFTQVQKLATIYACARETTNQIFPAEKSFDVNKESSGITNESVDETIEMATNPSSSRIPDNIATKGTSSKPNFTVTKFDVEAAYDFVQQSMMTLRSFKVISMQQNFTKLILNLDVTGI